MLEAKPVRGPAMPTVPAVTNIPDADRESALSSYGESFQADSPDPKDYFGRLEGLSFSFPVG